MYQRSPGLVDLKTFSGGLMPQKKAPRNKALAGEPRLPIGIGNGGNPCQYTHKPAASVDGPTTIPINGTVHLSGIAEEILLQTNCQLTTTPTSFSWELFFTPPNGAESSVGGLTGTSTLTPSFVASSFGTYRVHLTAGTNLLGLASSDLNITVFRPMELVESEGQITFLRVNEVGDSFGPAGDAIAVEAIVQLNTLPGMSFGFELRNDKQRPAHQGMLDVLRDAFVNDITVLIDYWIPEGNKNGTIIRVAAIK
jgi:hypothetical protein